MKTFNEFDLNELTIEQEKQLDELTEKFLNEYNDENAIELMELAINEGTFGSILGGLTGFALGKTVGKLLAKVLGIEKGILYDMLTSRLVGAALGAALGKRI